LRYIFFSPIANHRRWAESTKKIWVIANIIKFYFYGPIKSVICILIRCWNSKFMENVTYLEWIFDIETKNPDLGWNLKPAWRRRSEFTAPSHSTWKVKSIYYRHKCYTHNNICTPASFCRVKNSRRSETKSIFKNIKYQE
jgi:hypothetical protein